MCDMDNLETYPWDPKDPYGVRNIRPQSLPSAPKGGRPPLCPHSGEAVPVEKLKKFKPRTASKVLSTALHFERKILADLEREHSNKRFRSTAFINFCNLLEVSKHHPLIKTVEQVTLVFDYTYVPKQFLTLSQINSLDPSLFESADSGARPATANINWDLFPKAKPIQSTINNDIFSIRDGVNCGVTDPKDHTPQSGIATPSPVNPFAECGSAIRQTFTSYVMENEYLAWLSIMPLHYLLLGSFFSIVVIYRIVCDLILTLRFMIGFLFGYRVVHFSNKYKPQSGLESDDGAKFLGKVTPKFGSPPDKPATQGAPGISTVLNGKNLFQQPRVAPPKQISKKDPNDGPLNGFGIGI